MAKDKTERNYWMIPMDYKTYNFQAMQDEMINYKKIMWEIPYDPVKRKGEYTINPRGSIAPYLHKGDFIYFYVWNLPSENSSFSRVLLRGEVKDEPGIYQKKEIYKSSDDIRSKDETLTTGFSITNLYTLPNTKDKLKNNNFLSY